MIDVVDVRHAGGEHAQELANPGLPAPNPIPDVHRRREALDQRAVEIKAKPESPFRPPPPCG
jgi:hypothetical protein